MLSVGKKYVSPGKLRYASAEFIANSRVLYLDIRKVHVFLVTS